MPCSNFGFNTNSTQPKTCVAGRIFFRIISIKLTFDMRDQDFVARGHNTNFETSFFEIAESSDYIQPVAARRRMKSETSVVFI